MTSVLFFASILAHELGHSVVAIRNGIQVRSITLFVFGGVAQISRDAPRPMIEGMIAIAGPLVSVALGGLFLGLYFVIHDINQPVAALSLYLFQINIMVAVFNMIPGFPLDGGRLFRALVWALSGSFVTATRIAAAIGRGIGYLFIAGGIAWGFYSGEVFSGLWLAFIGWFLAGMAQQSGRQVVVRETLKGVRVRDVMSGDQLMIPAEMDLRFLVEHYVALTGLRSFLVRNGDGWAGVLSLQDIEKVSRNRWADTRADQIMIPASKITTVGPGDDLLQAMELMDAGGVAEVPVVENGGLVGMLRRDAVVYLVETLGRRRNGD